MGLFRDWAAEKAERESYVRKVNKMQGVSDRVRQGATPRGADVTPHACGQQCRPGYTCTSTVRGGVCPCRDC